MLDSERPLESNELICPVCEEIRDAESDTPLLAIDRELADHDGDPWNREPGWSVELARQGHFQWACNRCIFEEHAIRGRPWLQDWQGFDPYYAFYDREMQCAACGSDFVFTASEQQFWYEEKQFPLQSYPKHCLSCRRKRRAQKRR